MDEHDKDILEVENEESRKLVIIRRRKAAYILIKDELDRIQESVE